MWNLILTHTPLLYFVQSLWRDEAFSILAAERPLSFAATRLGFEPPFYYVLLHVWIKLFGNSEIAARSLSLLGFALACTIVIKWSEKLFKKHWLSWYLPLFFFVNPMLLYYAFEVRTYAWNTFFAVALLYTYANKRWAWFVLSAILGFYTHTYLLLFIATLVLHWILTSGVTRRFSVKKILRDTTFRSFAVIGLAISPWILRMILVADKLKNVWYFPVNFQLVKSVLGNMFLGYEGTPWYGWRYTAWLSLGLVILFGLALSDRKNHKRNILFFLYTTVPLAAVVAISFLKPLFVNRYLIQATVGEVFLVVAAIAAIKKPYLQKILAATLLTFVAWFNWWYPPQHPKLPIRDTITQVNSLSKDQDIILAGSPLIFFETLYYSRDRTRVFLYNPAGSPFPWYVGDVLVSPSQMIRDLPPYPIRAFLVKEDGSFEVNYRLQATSQATK